MVLHHYAPECLPVLHDFHNVTYNFITNYREERWLPIRLQVKVDRGVVSRVSDEVHRIAYVMMDSDMDVETFEHVAASR
jgi:hypothetical protein